MVAWVLEKAVQHRFTTSGKSAKTRRLKASKPAARKNLSSGKKPGPETAAARLTRELKEARKQQAATADVLRIISISRGDPQPVFDTIVRSAVRLSGARFGVLHRFDGKQLHVAAHDVTVAVQKVLARAYPMRPSRSQASGRAILNCDVVEIKDVLKDPDYQHDMAAAGGWRSLLAVPILRPDGSPMGTIVVQWSKPDGFADDHIELLKTFAAQAGIAIENTRLFGELRESLEQQTATADVLKVISSSPGDLDPVFNAILANATRICDAKFGMLWLVEGSGLRCVALHNAPEAFAEMRRREPVIYPTPKHALGRVADTKQVVHIADLTAEQVYADGDPIRRANADLAGARSLVAVPMLKDSELIGAISIYRQEVRPFTEKQIELVQNFSTQAVIAIENTRLLSELRESLEQQTATSKVLEVISSSPGELQRVFDAMLENATRICEAKFGTLFRFDGKAFHLAADIGSPTEFAKFLRRRGWFRPIPGSGLDHVLQTKKVRHTADYGTEAVSGPPVTLGGARSTIDVPMLKDDVLVGALAIYRQEVRPFTDKQIALVQNFAAQAVIAIENTRLLSELREALEQQTATSKVLEVISSSPGELQPVFLAMLENATRICEAKFGTLALCEGDALRAVALYGGRVDYADERRRNPVFRPAPNVPVMRAVRTKQVQHVADMLTEQAYIDRDTAIVTMVETGGARTFLAVPMLKDDEAIGVIIIYRQEVRPFTDKQIALVQNFAAQAVIAIENTRLLSELRQVA